MDAATQQPSTLQSISELVDDHDAARILNVTVGTLAVWRSTGRYKLPFIKIGHKVRYRRSDMEAWLASRTHHMGALPEQKPESTNKPMNY